MTQAVISGSLFAPDRARKRAIVVMLLRRYPVDLARKAAAPPSFGRRTPGSEKLVCMVMRPSTTAVPQTASIFDSFSVPLFFAVHLSHGFNNAINSSCAQRGLPRAARREW
jgi:hypothetical protein